MYVCMYIYIYIYIYTCGFQALAAAAGRVLAEELADEPHRWELHAAALQKVARTGRLCDDQVLGR